MKRTDQEHFLTRPATIRRLWWLFSGLLIATLLLQFAFPVKGYFGVDGWFAFGALYGFLSCLLMVLIAKALGTVLKRPRNFYRESDDDA